MSDDGFKEVCARFGAAMYFAQVLEYGLANAMVCVDLIPRTAGKWTSEEYDGYYEDNFAKTLGHLINRLKSFAPLPDELEVALKASKEKRNFLAHHFFRERNDDIQQQQFDDLVDELERARSFFQETDRKLDRFIGPLLARYGISEDILEREMEGYRAEMRRKP